MEFLVGSGLAAAAGLNAWMPLFLLGLADRFTNLVTLPDAWAWLSNDITLWITGVLLVVELVADKIPAVDSINDVIQTVIRPASGGIVFGAGASAEAMTLDDPTALFADGGWVPIVVGVVIALGMHGLKAVARPVANTATAGLAAPVVSTAENASSFVLVLLAVVAPILVALFLAALVFGGVMLIRRMRRRKRAAAAAA